MRIAHLTRACIAAAVASAALGSAQAKTTTLFAFDPSASAAVSKALSDKQNVFLNQSNLVNIKKEGFESPAVVLGTPSPVTSPLALFGGFGSLTQGPISKPGTVEKDTAFGRFNTTTDGSQWWETTGPFEVDLKSAVSAFGFFGTDFADFGGGMTIDLYSGTERIFSGLEPELPAVAAPAPSGSLFFFGYINDAQTFDRIVFTVTQGENRPVSQFNYIGLDDLIVGTAAAAVPEPTTLVLSGLGLGLLSLARRRTRK